jgi:hypothetical protein
MATVKEIKKLLNTLREIISSAIEECDRTCDQDVKEEIYEDYVFIETTLLAVAEGEEHNLTGIVSPEALTDLKVMLLEVLNDYEATLA